MKPIIFSLAILFMIANVSYSQVAQKRQMQQKKPDTLLKAKIADTSLYQKNIIKTSPINHTPEQNTVIPKNNSDLKLLPKKENIASVGSSNMQAGKAMASLFDIFISIKTGTFAGSGTSLDGDNKDRDTHWSCGVFDFDQNGNEKQVTDFHDNSDNDEYTAASITGPLKMNMDNSVLFNQFGNGGHVHINIAPIGNDTWEIDQFTLTLDFVNPKLSQTITWPGIMLSQDHRDADLYFIYDGQNFVPRQ
jgi:hypothetical protein